MKLKLFIISFLFVPILVCGLEKPYLSSLEITNGVNTLPFDSKNDLYTINVYDDVDALDINYKIDDPNIRVVIENNNLENDINDVYINLDNNELTNSYHLIVNKINNSVPTFNEINISDEKSDNQVMKVGVVIIFLISNILVIKKLLFSK